MHFKDYLRWEFHHKVKRWVYLNEHHGKVQKHETDACSVYKFCQYTITMTKFKNMQVKFIKCVNTQPDNELIIL